MGITDAAHIFGSYLIFHSGQQLEISNRFSQAADNALF